MDAGLVSGDFRHGSTPHVRLTLRRGDQEVTEESTQGDGPIDAAFWATEKITGIHLVCRDFQVRSATIGRDAQGEATLEVEHHGIDFPRPRRLHRLGRGDPEGAAERRQSHPPDQARIPVGRSLRADTVVRLSEPDALAARSRRSVSPSRTPPAGSRLLKFRIWRKLRCAERAWWRSERRKLGFHGVKRHTTFDREAPAPCDSYRGGAGAWERRFRTETAGAAARGTCRRARTSRIEIPAEVRVAGRIAGWELQIANCPVKQPRFNAEDHEAMGNSDQVRDQECGARVALCQFAIRNSQFAICNLQFAICILQFATPGSLA
jgi:hypothetical protein